MSEHDVPAGRDELRERLATTLAALVALRDVVRDSGELNGMEYDALGVEVNRAIEKAEAALLAPQEAREPELLGYVVERQLTTGEWMRVWRGSTMWVDHDEAVLDRDAYALDGIPARIRPVYLGAPAPRPA